MVISVSPPPISYPLLKIKLHVHCPCGCFMSIERWCLFFCHMPKWKLNKCVTSWHLFTQECNDDSCMLFFNVFLIIYFFKWIKYVFNYWVYRACSALVKFMHVSLCLFLFFQRWNDTVVDGYLLFKISQERNCNWKNKEVQNRNINIFLFARPKEGCKWRPIYYCNYTVESFFGVCLLSLKL